MSDEMDLWQFLEAREEEIVRKRKELLTELEALRNARASLEKERRDKDREDGSERMTIKEMVRSVLSRNPEGGTSDQIINWINQIHASEVARTSLSPQLSRLKADGIVMLDEDTGIWKLRNEELRMEQLLRSNRSTHERSRNMLRYFEDEQKRRS
ncbi:hypothetical protein [Sinisalibacter aestuarii]|uniref:Uncharacterized protein n=1 Tax=Sinisalibacter aestuarii TaxID=2949426 RepID=A0ABQ5LX76_9RHOB|nr:hypothetical protein [Sinisalibacter aestuarii]GKY88886.1 hypothetical protein STA1M1_27550 [Sinisalibacter aestuarii]